MTETTRSCIDCGEPIQYPESRCPDCYDDWLETPEGSADKLQVEKWVRLMALWIGKSGPGADLARAICWLTKNVETGDAAEFANVAKQVLYALNLAGQGLGIPDAEIAPLPRAAVNASSSRSRAVDLAEGAAGGSEPAEPTEASEMIAGQLDSVAVQVAEFCDELDLCGSAVAAGLKAGADRILAYVAGRYPEE